MQLIFLRKSDYFGCAVLLASLFVCLLLPSHLSLKHVYIYIYIPAACTVHVYTCTS